MNDLMKTTKVPGIPMNMNQRTILTIPMRFRVSILLRRLFAFYVLLSSSAPEIAYNVPAHRKSLPSINLGEVPATRDT